MIYQTYDEKYRAVPYVDTREGRDLYRYQVALVTEEFKDALAAEYLYTFSKETTDDVWRLAWDMGHSSGYSEVEIHYEELATLVSDVADRILRANQ